jgi:hypothetical protein
VLEKAQKENNMAKKLKVNKEDVLPIRQQFMEDLKELVANLDSNPENYLKPIHLNKTYTIPQMAVKQKIYIRADAYLQMLQLVLKSSKEIAWHSTVIRNDANSYTITKCLLYPQTVTGATVTTDQDKYNEWLQNLDDDVFNSLRCQAHSHVNMGVTPSTVDMNFYEDLVASLPDNSYYIFLVMNKSQDIYALIYDKVTNMLYTKEDIDVIVLDNEDEHLIEDINTSMAEFVSEHHPMGFRDDRGIYNYGGAINKSLKDPDLYDENYWDKFYDDLDKDMAKYSTPNNASLKEIPRLKSKKKRR